MTSKVTKTAGGGSKKLRRDARREAILTSAAKTFVKNGYEATSLDDIASEAGVSRPLIYVHFASKKELYIAILRGDWDAAAPKLDDISTPDKARQRIAALVASAQKEPDRFRLLFRHAIREPEFKQYIDERNTLSEAFVFKALSSYIPDAAKRKVATHMTREAVMSTLLAWADCGCPDPDVMPELLLNIIGDIIAKLC